METSLFCVLTVLLAIALRRASSPVSLFVLALALSLMRVDLTLLVSFGVGLMLLERQWKRPSQLGFEQRAAACMSQRPSFLFVSDAQVGSLEWLTHLQKAEWLECGNVAFSNAASEDRHWLRVRRTDYPQGCPAQL
jgi:hypothetical protein